MGAMEESARSAGFDPKRLARIDEFLQERYIASDRLPNALLLISRNGETAHASVLGKARADGRPLTRDTIFRIASMTKPITSVAFMMLVEEGKIALEDPVHRIIPELKGVGVYSSGGGGAPFVTTPTSAPMRMVDLLRHTSGLTYDFQNRTPVDAAYRDLRLGSLGSREGPDAYCAALGKLPLEFSPGEAWNYSVSTDVLGIVVERLSGQSLEAFFQERIFKPLGMRDSSFVIAPEKLDRLGDCWALDPKNGIVTHDLAETTRWKSTNFYGGGGGLLSTADDYQRFCAMLLNGGVLDGARLLAPKTVQLMTQNHLPGKQDLTQLSRSLYSESTYAGVGFGLGFAIVGDVASTMVPGSPGEYFWGGMYSTAFFIDPIERIAMTFMTQLMPSGAYPIRRQIKTMIYAALERPNA